MIKVKKIIKKYYSLFGHIKERIFLQNPDKQAHPIVTVVISTLYACILCVACFGTEITIFPLVPQIGVQVQRKVRILNADFLGRLYSPHSENYHDTILSLCIWFSGMLQQVDNLA